MVKMAVASSDKSIKKLIVEAPTLHDESQRITAMAELNLDAPVSHPSTHVKSHPFLRLTWPNFLP